MIVKLDNVVNRITGNEDRFTTDLQYYIGGEHYDCGNPLITNRGLIRSEKGSLLGFKFHFPFKKGDVLFMARNPHLKKAGMVTFDGICSDASYILRSKDENILLQKFLPFVIQNDKMWQFFEANKSGSVNYLMNWKELKNYEFNLPSLNEQKKLAETLWQIVDTMESYKKLLFKTDEMIKAKFVEMFGAPLKNTKNWKTDELNNLYIKIGRGKQPEYCEQSNIQVINQACIYNDRIKFENVKFHSEQSNKIKVLLSDGDVLINSTGTGTLGRCNVFRPQNCAIQYIADGHVTVLKQSERINSIFMKTYINFSEVQTLIYSEYVTGSTNQVELSKEKISKHNMIVPPIQLQKTFADFVEKAEYSKTSIQASLDSLMQVYKKIIIENLS